MIAFANVSLRDLEIFRAYQEGASSAQLAPRYGLHEWNIKHIVKRVSRQTGEPKRASHTLRKGQTPCRHCRYRSGCRPRQLCTTCYNAPEIREQYAPVTASGEYGTRSREYFVGLFPVLRIYPDKALSPRCLHGRHDGECPACEREQRSKIHFAEATEGSDAD